ncbi:MAG: hypothetical protein ACI4SV_04565 [Duodenibacillus sp.]
MKKLSAVQNKLVTLLAVRQPHGLYADDAATLMGLPKPALMNLSCLLERAGIVKRTDGQLSLQPGWADRIQKIEVKGKAAQEDKPAEVQTDICEIARALAVGGKK